VSTQQSTGDRQPYSTAFGEEVLAFLQSDQQRVLLIHGRWGTGKTYFWKRFVKQNTRTITEAYYSYVSLFGSTSLSDVKSIVIFGGDPLRAARGMEDVVDRIKNRFARVRKRFGAVSVPYIGNLASILPSFEELLIKDYLVCFDDLERRNRQLDLEQFFGLVSVLKEQNNCRIVIVCNEEELSPRDRRILAKYREKIVDRQLSFEPPFEENFRLIFSDTDQTTRDIFEALHLNNIRVFQQTSWCLRYFQPYLAGCGDAFVQQFRQQCVKLACVHYALSKHLTFEQVQTESWLLAGWEQRAEIQTESSRLIEQLKFSPSEADELIIDYLRNGYCDRSKLKEVVARLNENLKRREGDAAIHGVWALVYDDFQADLSAVEDAASKCIEQFRGYLRIDSLKYLLDFLHEMDTEFDKTKLLEQLALEAVGTTDFEILQQVQTAGVSEAVKSAVAKRRVELLPTHTIGDLIAALSYPDGWNPKDYLTLDAYSEDELYDWLLKAQGSRLIGDIAVVVVRARTSAPEEKGRALADKLQRVMAKLAERSKLDEFRVTRYFSERVRKGLAERGIHESNGDDKQ
jgi:hypothetical protein